MIPACIPLWLYVLTILGIIGGMSKRKVIQIVMLASIAAVLVWQLVNGTAN